MSTAELQLLQMIPQTKQATFKLNGAHGGLAMADCIVEEERARGIQNPSSAHILALFPEAAMVLHYFSHLLIK